MTGLLGTASGTGLSEQLAANGNENRSGSQLSSLCPGLKRLRAPCHFPRPLPSRWTQAGCPLVATLAFMPGKWGGDSQPACLEAKPVCSTVLTPPVGPPISADSTGSPATVPHPSWKYCTFSVSDCFHFPLRMQSTWRK